VRGRGEYSAAPLCIYRILELAQNRDAQLAIGISHRFDCVSSYLPILHGNEKDP